MIKSQLRFFVSIGIIVILTASGCSLLPGKATPPPLPPTADAPAGDVPSAPNPALIQHLTKPTSGNKAVANAHDNDESATFAEKSVRSGDEFRINRFERPFTATDMNYLPHIDIVGMSMTQDDEWFYVQIKVVGLDAQTGNLSGLYGVEFDLNVDGKTEILVLAQGPLGKDWTTDGVTVYADTNGDIGGLSSKPDDIYTGNGYETILFDSGVGQDPDAAWARSNSDNFVVELAFKKELMKDYPTWMWNPLASDHKLDPTTFYYNDTLTEARAGSPTKGNVNYPLKELAGFDNTCRVPANFEPNGSEPMGCGVSKQNDVEFTPGSGYPQ